MTRPTPETDEKESECNRLPLTFAFLGMRDHARKLERERDEAREALQKITSLQRFHVFAKNDGWTDYREDPEGSWLDTQQVEFIANGVLARSREGVVQ